MVLALVFEQLRISFITEQRLRGHNQKLVNALRIQFQAFPNVFTHVSTIRTI